MIDGYYNNVIASIQAAAYESVVRVPTNVLKPYWNYELDNLKQTAISWHDIWLAAGKAQSGQLFHIKCSTKLKYKSAVRDAYIVFEHQHDDEIYRHFMNKKPREFWKNWGAKFRRNVAKNIVVGGCHNGRHSKQICLSL